MPLWFWKCQYANACVMCEEVFLCHIIILTDLSKSVAAPFILTTTASSQRQLVRWQKSNSFSSTSIRKVESETQESIFWQGSILEQQGHRCSSRGSKGLNSELKSFFSHILKPQFRQVQQRKRQEQVLDNNVLSDSTWIFSPLKEMQAKERERNRGEDRGSTSYHRGWEPFCYEGLFQFFLISF